MKKRIFTQEEIEKVIYNYTVLHMGQKRAGAEFHMNDRLVKRLLTENGVHIKTIQETNISSYKINIDFFKTQSTDLGYLLGLLSSDGCVASNENCIYIELQESDSSLLEQINAIIGNERQIKHYTTKNNYKNCKLYFYSREIKEILGEYGIVPNKTYSKDFHFPYSLDKRYWLDYIRGYFDGDGSITYSGNTLRFQIDSVNLPLLQHIQNFLLEEYNIKTAITKCDACDDNRTVPLYRLYNYSQAAIETLQLLYSTQSELKLERKYQKFLEALSKKK